MEMQDNEGLLNVTIAGLNGDLREPVQFDATDADIKAWATEAVRTGGVPGIDAIPDASFVDYVVDRFRGRDGLPNRLVLRPKTPFGQ